MSDPDVTPDPALGGGHALIRVPGAAAAATDPRFRLSRDGYDAGMLGPRGWQVADALLEPLSARADGADLVLSVGPALVDVVESGVVMLSIPAAKFDEPLFWPELPLSRGGAGSVGLAMPAAVPAVATPPNLHGVQKVGLAPPPNWDRTAQSPPAPVPPRPEAPIAARPRRSMMPLMLIGLLVLAAAGAGGWHVLHRPTTSGIPQPPAPTPPHPTPVQPGPSIVPPANRTARDCGQGSIADIVACASDPDALVTLAQRKLNGGQADQGLVLMQIAADRGSGLGALKLAQIYDPNSPPQADRRVQPNAREAAQYYRRAVQAHQNAAVAPREALRQRLLHDADNGDAMAPLTLRDFWP